MLRKTVTSLLAGVAFAINHACSQPQEQYPFVQVVTYRANNPIEDRHCYTRLKSIEAFTATVFDGHGGDLTSEYASKNLNRVLDHRLSINKKLSIPVENIIEKSLKEAYDDIEQGFFAIFKENLDKKAYQRVGSCALTAVVLKNSLHVANSGDCEGILLSEGGHKMVNQRLNAGEKAEQQRLSKLFPTEVDIVMCWGACYTKGRLQPTRSLGDYYLKYKEYNFTKLQAFTGPYIVAEPIVTHFKLEKGDSNLIMASDGLWDQMNGADVHRVYKGGSNNLSQRLFDYALSIILRRNKLESIHQLNKIAYRRDLHDDITVVNVRLDQVRSLLS